MNVRPGATASPHLMWPAPPTPPPTARLCVSSPQRINAASPGVVLAGEWVLCPSSTVPTSTAGHTPMCPSLFSRPQGLPPSFCHLWHLKSFCLLPALASRCSQINVSAASSHVLVYIACLPASKLIFRAVHLSSKAVDSCASRQPALLSHRPVL